MRPVALLLAASLLGAGCGAARTNRLGSAPVKLGTAYFMCPLGSDTIAYRGRFYPPNFPRRPAPSIRPDRCFRSMSAAARTGYALAPTPRSDLLVDGIYLVPADASLRHACIRAAHVAGFPVPCPSLMPYPPTSVGGCGGVTRCYRSGEFVLEGNFVGPPEYVGNDAGSGHLWFLAATPAKRADVECFSGKREAATVTVRGHPGHWLVCPPGSELNSGHVILEWPEHGVVYAISLHGDSAPNRRLDLALARRSALVR